MKHRRRSATPMPLLLFELGLFSWETMVRRTSMMMQGVCTAAEYQRMLLEKVHAAQLSGKAILRGRDSKTVLAPWHRAVRANARRLRK